MRVQINYRAEFIYQEPVSFSPHAFRLFPRADKFLSVLGVSFRTNRGASIHYRRDLFDNEVARCFYPELSNTLLAELELELEVRPKNAFGFLVETHAQEFPFEYQPEEQTLLAPFLSIAADVAVPFWEAVQGPTVNNLIALNTSMHQNLAYERREEGPARSAQETLALGGGSCRDFAQLMTAVLRTHGIAARIASGYLCEFDTEAKRAEGALHAWCEAYVPGAGWLGMDPTNGILCDENHIATAVGRTFCDVAPITGSYYGPEPVASQLQTSLSLACLPCMESPPTFNQ